MSLTLTSTHAAALAAAPTIVLSAGAGAPLVVPLGAFLLTASYARVGGDLLLTGPGGDPSVVIRDYFLVADPPALTTENGATVEAALAMHLAGARAPGQYAAGGETEAAQPVGRVTEITGEATATRVDGTTVVLTKDTPVYQGDIIETADGAALEVVFIDESSFSVGENGRMVLDEMVFDPSTLQGESAISVLQGVFVFVSGEIAANNPEQMAIKTPVATIGIRGTAVAISAAQEGEQNKVVLLTEQAPNGEKSTGAVVISNEAGSVVLDQAFETTVVQSAFSAPGASFISNASDLKSLVGQLGDAAPTSVQYLAPSPQSSQSGGTAEANADQPAGEPGEPGAPGEGEGPDQAGEAEAPSDAPPDASLFAEEAGLFEDAALVVEGMLAAEEGKPPPGEAGPLGPEVAFEDGPQLSMDGLAPLTESALAQAVGAGVPAPPPDGAAPAGKLGSGSIGSVPSLGSAGPLGAYTGGVLGGDPVAADNLSGGFATASFGSFGTPGTFGFSLDTTLAPPPNFFAPPPPDSTGTTAGNEFFPPPSDVPQGVALFGGSANENLFGSGFGDFLDGGGGNDSLFGFAGPDILIGGTGNDLIDGGDGFDIVDYSENTSSGVTLDLGSGTASSAESGTDTLVSIESILGTQFADTLTGSSGDDVINTGGGSDYLTGGGGNDTYIVGGGSGTTILTIDDSADSSTSDVLVMGTYFDDALPIDFDYTLSGNNLVIRFVLGNPANEQGTIIDFATTGEIESFEFFDVTSGPASLPLTLKTGGGTASGTSSDDFIAVADTTGTTVNGGLGNDYLIGNSGADIISGGAGADKINGNGGGDSLDGGIGDDYYLVIPTTSTTELITDSAGSDTLEIGGGIGFKARNNGSDLILDFTNGTTASVVGQYTGSPVEFLEIEKSGASFVIALGSTGSAADDLIAGGTGVQTLVGGAGADLIYGAGGNDSLDGGAGNDILVGGAGADILSGGATSSEADHFRYFDTGDGASATNGASGLTTGDQITDFISGVDRFDFHNAGFGFGTSELTAVNGTTFFSVSGFDGTNASASGGGNDYFVFDPTSLTLYYDDGSNGTGYTVIATVQSGGTVVAGDIQVSSLGGPTAY